MDAKDVKGLAAVILVSMGPALLVGLGVALLDGWIILAGVSSAITLNLTLDN